jgi:hypothetical protein
MCRCDFSSHSCAGVNLVTDSPGGDTIKFDQLGPFQYIVYVSIFKGANSSPKVSKTKVEEVTLSDSMAQLKVFSPYYQWPVFVFDVPTPH